MVGESTRSSRHTPADRADTDQVDVFPAQGEEYVVTSIPFPVVSVNEIRRGSSLLIPRGTPGEITGVSGATPSHYTVTFWPFGLDGATVTITDLTRNDLIEA